MKIKIVTITTLVMLVAGCASPKTFNIKNDYIAEYKGQALSTYADYGSKVEYNSDERLHQLSVYTGGGASCDNGAISYAKSKLDKFMKTNKYSSYTVVKGQYSLVPLSKCELYIRFEK